MNEEYEDYKDSTEERKESSLKNLNKTTLVIVFIILVVVYYFLKAGNAETKDFIIIGVGAVILVVVLTKAGSPSKIEYINVEVARGLLIDYLKNYEKLSADKVCKIILPKGKIKLGYHSLVPHYNIKSQKDWIYWDYGFKIYDEDEDNREIYFLARIDPVVGGLGVLDLKNLKEEYKGPPEKQFFIEPMPVPAERYFDMKNRGEIKD